MWVRMSCPSRVESGCVEPSPSVASAAVRVHVGTVAGLQRRGDVHRISSLPAHPPFGSTKAPSPALSVVVTFIAFLACGSSAVRVDVPAVAGLQRRREVHWVPRLRIIRRWGRRSRPRRRARPWSCSWDLLASVGWRRAQPPLGSMKPASPAFTAVVVFMESPRDSSRAASAVGVDAGGVARAHRGRCVHELPRFAAVLSRRWGRCRPCSRP